MEGDGKGRYRMGDGMEIGWEMEGRRKEEGERKRAGRKVERKGPS